MAITEFSVKEIVDKAVGNELGMPEFQRGFVWSPSKVAELADSLMSEFPVGSLLLWRETGNVETAVGRNDDSRRPKSWIVDGQQRTTALCLLFGHKPRWWHGDEASWSSACDKFDIRVNPLAEDADFQIPKATVKRDKRFISVRSLLNADDDAIERIADQLHQNNPNVAAMRILRSLQNVKNIADRRIPAFEQTNSIEETVEIFVRLNQAGEKVKEGDIALALVASRNPNWVNNTFRPFVDELENAGFDLEPTLVLRSLVASETELWDTVITRLGNVEPSFWDTENLNPRWAKIDRAWRAVIDGLKEYGIFDSDMLQSKNALIPVVAMAVAYGNRFQIEPALAWLIRATCTNRYSRTTDTRLAEDVRAIREGSDLLSSAQIAISKLDFLDFEEESNHYFKRSYKEKEVQLMLYLLAYDNQAHDWTAQADRIGFAGTELRWECKPNWHHIFPRAYLKSHLPDDRIAAGIIDQAANVAVIGKASNLHIKDRPPMDYMKNISDALLKSQHVPTDRNLFTSERYDEFIEQRAAALAVAANNLLDRLKNGTPGASAL